MPQRMAERRLNLVVPPGLDRHIFPWGIHALRDYLGARQPSVQVELGMLAGEAMAPLLARHSELYAEVFGLLDTRARSALFGHTLSGELLASALAGLGGRLLDVPGLLRQSRRVRRGLRGELEAHARDYRSWLAHHLRAMLPTEGGPCLWGISVYDYTLGGALTVLDVVGEIDPGARILMGGDYFDHESARALVQEHPAVEAVCVGYGEEVLDAWVSWVLGGGEPGGPAMPGLVSRGWDGEGITIPTPYREPTASSPIQFVRASSPHRVQVLTQRGCSWGHCAFCSQLDRRLHYPVHPAHLTEALGAALDQARPGPNGRVHIRLDADENDLEVVLQLIDQLLARDPRERFVLEFWMMVRMFETRLLERLAGAGERVRLLVLMNVESFNLATLRTMRKGHAPLDAIAALKCIQDAGHLVQSNYFLAFPGEQAEDVAQEVAIFRRVMHLLMPPRARLVGFAYAANARDTLHAEADRFGHEVRRNPADRWVAQAHGVDLPSTIWSYELHTPRPQDVDGVVRLAYRRAMEGRKAMRLSEGVRWVLTTTPTDRRRRALTAMEHPSHLAWLWVYKALRRMPMAGAHRERDRLVAYLEQVARGDEEVLRSVFVRRGDRLLLDWQVPGAERAEVIPLTGLDVWLLDELYVPRRRRRVVEDGAARWCPEEIAASLDRLVELGALIELKGWVLGVVNEPERWADGAMPLDSSPRSSQAPSRSAG